MNKDKELDQAAESPKNDASKRVDLRRRDLAKAGLAGGAILATLTSRPALGLECTDSLVASWNTSAHPDIEDCAWACSPGAWKPTVPHGYCRWDETGIDPILFFDDVFGKPDTYDHDNDNGEESPTAEIALPSPFSGSTLGQVILMAPAGSPPRQNNLDTAGFHAVAALLNLSHFLTAASYGYLIGGTGISDLKDEFWAAYINYLSDGPDAFSSFLAKYDVYERENTACPIPQSCK